MNHNSSRSQFGVRSAVIVLIGLSLVAALVWLIAFRPSSEEQTNDLPAQDLPLQVINPGEFRELDQSVSLILPDDVSRLPEDIPGSFSSFVGDALSAAHADEAGCYPRYTVGQISAVNISGTMSMMSRSADAIADSCQQDEQVVVWSLVDEQWIQTTILADNNTACATLRERKIYIEFVEECADGNRTGFANPVGSIKQLAVE